MAYKTDTVFIGGAVALDDLGKVYKLFCTLGVEPHIGDVLAVDANEEESVSVYVPPEPTPAEPASAEDFPEPFAFADLPTPEEFKRAVSARQTAINFITEQGNIGATTLEINSALAEAGYSGTTFRNFCSELVADRIIERVQTGFYRLIPESQRTPKKTKGPKGRKASKGGGKIKDIVLAAAKEKFPSPISRRELQVLFGKKGVSPNSVDGAMHRLIGQNLLRRTGTANVVYVKGARAS